MKFHQDFLKIFKKAENTGHPVKESITLFTEYTFDRMRKKRLARNDVHGMIREFGLELREYFKRELDINDLLNLKILSKIGS